MKFANLRMVLRENYELFHSLLGVMSIRCYFLRVTKYFLRQWAYRYVVNRHTTSWAPVLTNRQFKECMFTYM